MKIRNPKPVQIIKEIDERMTKSLKQQINIRNNLTKEISILKQCTQLQDQSKRPMAKSEQIKHQTNKVQAMGEKIEGTLILIPEQIQEEEKQKIFSYELAPKSNRRLKDQIMSKGFASKARNLKNLPHRFRI